MLSLTLPVPIPIPIHIPVLLTLFISLLLYLHNRRSPLASIPPAHPLAPYTRLWILYTRHQNRELRTIHSAHARLGPVIRLAPNELSVNCLGPGGLGGIYAGGWDKSAWYAFFANYGVPPMFATIPSKRHAARKRMLSNVYSKSAIQSSPSLRTATSAILHDRLLPLLAGLASESGEKAGTINIYDLFAALTMDFITAYLFGLSASTNFVQDTAARDEYLRLYRCRQDYSFWPQELPKLTSFLAKMGLRLVPKFADEANASLEAFNRRMCEKARTVVGKTSAAENPEVFPAVYAQMQSAMARDQEKASANGMAPLSDEEKQIEMASEFLDHSSAGFETSSITLAYFAHEISQRPELQGRLREELRTLNPPLTLASKPELPSAKALDALPLLQATLQETLRLHAAIPGPQPRVTPAKGASLGPSGQEYRGLPGGVKVMSQAWSLHRNEDVFPEAEKWVPERWLDSKGELLTAESEEGGERYREMMRWFWAFGSGGRMCVGSHLAAYQMKAIIAGVWTWHSTRIVDDAGMEQTDRYTAPPQGSRLVARVVKDAEASAGSNGNGVAAVMR